MSWIGDETGGVHMPVPKELQQEVEAAAKAAIEVFG
jgi:20S proteasome subunit alpha 7